MALLSNLRKSDCFGPGIIVRRRSLMDWDNYMYAKTVSYRCEVRLTRSRVLSNISEDIKSEKLKILLIASTTKTIVKPSLTIGHNI